MRLLDLFRPKWKQSDVETRLSALKELKADEIDIFEEIAISDPDVQVRRAAAERISQREDLERLAEKDPDPAVVEVIQQKLDVERTRELIADAADWQGKLQAIRSEDALVDIVLQTHDAELRLAAMQRIEKASCLTKLALKKCGKEVGLTIVGRLLDINNLRKVAEHGSNNAVRKAAAAKVDKLAPPEGPDDQELRNQELVQLCEHARELQDSWNFEAVGKLLAEDADKWKQLDPDDQHELAADFHDALDKFQKRSVDFEERQKQEQVNLEAVKACRMKKEKLCEQLIELDPLAEDVRKQAQEIERLWEEMAPLPQKQEDELRLRFATANEKVMSNINQVGEERDILEKLGRLATRMKVLAEGDDWAAIEKALKDHSWPTDALKLLDDTEPRERFETAMALMKTHIGERREAKSSEDKARLARLKELLKIVEDQCAVENHGTASHAVREAQKEWNKLRGSSEADLQSALRAALDKFYKREREHREEREWDEWHNKGVKEELIKEVQACSENKDLPQIAKIIREAQIKWKQTGSVPRASSDSMWQDFHSACEENYARCKVFFDQQREQRQEHLKKAIDLCERAEALQDSTDWRDTTDALKALQEEWREVGSLPRKENKTIYQRFRKACNQFFEQRRSHYDEMDGHRAENNKQKEQLIADVEALIESAEQHHPGACIDLQNRWKRIGPAMRGKEEKLWQKFREACDRFFKKLDEDRVEHQQAKEKICERVEALVNGLTEDSDRNQVAREIMELQKAWKEVGPAPRDSEDGLWKRFRVPCDKFFADRRQKFQEMDDERERHQAIKQDLLMQAESLIDSTDWRDAGNALKDLQVEWKRVGSASKDKEIWKAFRSACDHFFKRRDAHYDKLDGRRLSNLKRKEKLIAELEHLLGVDKEEAPEKESTLSLAEELTLALEANFAMASQSRSLEDEIRQIQSDWKRVGPVPHEFDKSLWNRYKKLMDQHYGKK